MGFPGRMEDVPVKPNLLQIPVKRIADAYWEVSERTLPPLCQVVWDHPHLVVRPRLPVAATQVYGLPRPITEVVNGPSAECVKSYPRGSFAFRSAIKVVPMEFRQISGSNKGTRRGSPLIWNSGVYCGTFLKCQNRF